MREIMHRAAVFTLLALLAFTVPAKEAEPLSPDPALEARVMRVAEELRCLVCQNETLAASQADLAVDLRRQIRLQLTEGRNDAQIVDYMVERYGEFVRYRPAFNPTTALLWLGPFALLVLAGFVLAKNIQRRRLDARADPSNATSEAVAADPPRPSDGSKLGVIAVGGAMLVFAVCVYAAIGNPAAIGSSGAAPIEASTDDMEAMLAAVAKRLETPGPNPATDAQGWTMLARSYAALQRFADADRAFARAMALVTPDAQLLVDRADVMAVLQSGRMSGEPALLVARALQLDPRNLKGLALSGTAAFERQDFAMARRQWLAARSLAPPDSAFAAGLDRSLAEVPGDATSPVRVADATPARISGRVSLSPAVAGRVAPDDVVFITARAVDGPRMPLAIVRKRAADLPMDFALDDALAMSPEMKLSKFSRVVVTARISRSGDAMPQAGDPRVDSAPVDVRASGVQLTISSAQP